MTFNKETRQAVYDKYDGHCAYCGKEIAYKDMQVDHLVAKRNWNCDIPNEEIECFENYMPACRRCNHYKRAHTLEDFREMIATIPDKLFKNNYIFKVGVDYGFFVPDTRKVAFYFEQTETEN